MLSRASDTTNWHSEFSFPDPASIWLSSLFSFSLHAPFLRLSNHAGDIIGIDFFTAPTATFRNLYCFIILLHKRRQIVHFNVTEHPTGVWMAQQLIEASPEDTAPRFLVRD